MLISEEFLTPKQLGLIGVEIEMEGQMFVTPGGWIAKRDGSLRGNSIEWVFNRPVSFDLTRRRVERLYRINQNSGAIFKPSPRCGVHVHFNCQTLTKQQVFSLALFWYIFEGLLVRWCGENREGNLFCLRAEDNERVVRTLANGLLSNKLRNVVLNWDKYTGLNLYTLRQYGSVEFRTLQTPDTPEKVLQWIDILHALYQFAINVPNVARFIEGLSQTGYIDVLKTVFGELVETLLLPDAERLIMKSLRIVQFAIYATELPKPVKVEKKRPESALTDLIYETNTFVQEFPINVSSTLPSPTWRRVHQGN